MVLVYLEFGSSETMTLNILLGSNNQDKEREWNIEILMIPCRATLRAPAGCLQYFQGLSGQVTSFNYLQGQHIANLGYSICVRLEEGMRSIDVSPKEMENVNLNRGLMHKYTLHLAVVWLQPGRCQDFRSNPTSINTIYNTSNCGDLRRNEHC